MQRQALSVTEAAEALGVSRSHLYELWAEGRGPARLKSGRRTLVPVEAVSTWLRDEARMTSTCSAAGTA